MGDAYDRVREDYESHDGFGPMKPSGGRDAGYTVKDSGERLRFGSGMQRDTTVGKLNWLLIRPGPMLRRWAQHLSTAAAKYDTEREPGEPRNWQLAEGMAELERFQESAARHFEQWLNNERDEDHAAAVFFNINGAEYVRDKLTPPSEVPADMHEAEATAGPYFDFPPGANNGPDS